MYPEFHAPGSFPGVQKPWGKLKSNGMTKQMEKTMTNKNVIDRFKALVSNKCNVPMFPPFKKGDHLVGIYAGNGVQNGITGLTEIIIVEDANGERVGVYRGAYLSGALALKKPKVGDLISIRCTGEGHNELNRRYPILEIMFDDIDKYAGDDQQQDELPF